MRLTLCVFTIHALAACDAFEDPRSLILFSSGNSARYAILEYKVDNWKRCFFPANDNRGCRHVVFPSEFADGILDVDGFGCDYSAGAVLGLVGKGGLLSRSGFGGF